MIGLYFNGECWRRIPGAPPSYNGFPGHLYAFHPPMPVLPLDAPLDTTIPILQAVLYLHPYQDPRSALRTFPWCGHDECIDSPEMAAACAVGNQAGPCPGPKEGG